jgi:hypothetical protein
MPEEQDEFRQALATSYGRLLTLRGAVIEALEAAEKSAPKDRAYVDAHEDRSASAFHERMQALHDELMVKLRNIRTIADDCAFYDTDMGSHESLASSCTLPGDLDLRDDYAYRVRLPVLASAPDTAASVVKAAIIDQHVRDVSRRRCERDLEDPGCLLESDVEKRRKAL